MDGKSLKNADIVNRLVWAVMDWQDADPSEIEEAATTREAAHNDIIARLDQRDELLAAAKELMAARRDEDGSVDAAGHLILAHSALEAAIARAETTP